MSKILPTLIAAAFAAVTVGAYAADDAKAERKAARDEYKADMAKCKPMKGKEEKACKEEAKSKRDQKLAQIKDEKKAEKNANKTKSPSSGSTTAPATPSTTK